MIFQINIIAHKWRGATVTGTLKLIFIRKQDEKRRDQIQRALPEH